MVNFGQHSLRTPKTGVAIDTVYLYHFVDPFWGDILGEREGNRFKFEASALELVVEENFMQCISAFFGGVFGNKKKNST